MVKTKSNKLLEKLIFLYFVIFPFGQIIKVFSIHPVDVMVAAIVLFFHKTIISNLTKYMKLVGLWVGFIFSLFLGSAAFNLSLISVAPLYLVRFTFYGFLLAVLLEELNSNMASKILDGLVISGIFIAIFGWFQYFIYPDLTALRQWGWDDHLGRLVSTFLDPTFTGILLVFSYILSLGLYHFKKKKAYLLASILFLVTIGFTYSRSSYLALGVSSLVLSLSLKKAKYFLLTTLVLLVIIPVLPKARGEGVNLARTSSVVAKLENYQEGFNLFLSSPVFGVGYNTLCEFRDSSLGHSCSGFDSSLLFITTTTGIVGLVLFIDVVIWILKLVKNSKFKAIFVASGAGLFIHALFANSLVYPWVMGFMVILLAASVSFKVDK